MKNKPNSVVHVAENKSYTLTANAIVKFCIQSNSGQGHGSTINNSFNIAILNNNNSGLALWIPIFLPKGATIQNDNVAFADVYYI